VASYVLGGSAVLLVGAAWLAWHSDRASGRTRVSEEQVRLRPASDRRADVRMAHGKAL
jgi:hypothetical protein